MKLIIAGGRDHNLSQEDFDYLDEIHRVRGVTEVVCGMANGVDMDGYEWAKKNKIPVKEFPADWAKYGKSAGPIRNREMAKYADALFAFSGGRGTDNMINEATRNGLMIFHAGE